MRGLKFILGVILIVLVINMSGLVFALNDLVALQGNVKQAGVVLSSGNLTVVIYDSESGGNIIYNSTNDFDNSIFNGKYGVMLGNGSNELNLNFSQLYYLDIWVNGENFNFSGNDRQMFQSSVGDLIVNGTGVLLNIKNDTNSFLFVTGDSGYIGVGTTSPSNTLDVRGQGNFSGKVYINNATDISTWESNVSRNWTIPAIDYANLLNKTKNIQELLNSTGVYSIPLTINNNTKNIQELLNSTGVYSIPLTINNTKNLQEILNSTGIYSDKDTNVTTVCSGDQVLLGNGSCQSQASLGVGDANTLDGLDSSHFFPENKSLDGAQYDWGGGWTSNGTTIIGGEIRTQRGFFVNLTGLNVNNLNIDGSLMPAIGFDNSFDIGNSSLRWRNIYLSNDVIANGSIFVSGVGISDWSSVNETDLALSLNNTKNLQEILNSTGVYSIPLTINNTKNLQEILNSTGIYTIPLTINSSENLIPVLEGLINSTSWLRNGANVILSNLGDLIGIGTATPTAVLEINSTNPNLLNISNSSDTILFVNGSTGDVGIGTSNPDSALDVSGGNLTITNETASPLYFKFSEGGYMYDNGTALILGHD